MPCRLESHGRRWPFPILATVSHMTKRSIANISQKTGMSEADALSRLEKLSPQNRLIEPEEVARVAVMLASDEARGINGQAINIDGGAVFY